MSTQFVFGAYGLVTSKMSYGVEGTATVTGAIRMRAPLWMRLVSSKFRNGMVVLPPGE
jgi:hypothetical protein